MKGVGLPSGASGKVPGSAPVAAAGLRLDLSTSRFLRISKTAMELLSRLLLCRLIEFVELAPVVEVLLLRRRPATKELIDGEELN